jgi:hypothetical protein
LPTPSGRFAARNIKGIDGIRMLCQGVPKDEPATTIMLDNMALLVDNAPAGR